VAEQLDGVLNTDLPSLRAAWILLALISLISLMGCGTTPPSQSNDLCQLFEEKPKWLKAARRSEDAWGTPIHVQMSIMFQESGFNARARPKRTRILGIIPGSRPSNAYGYPQAKDETWDWYKRETGNRGADRDKFHDAIDFIGWYTQVSQQKLGLSKWDPKAQYLAYHEGHGGYSRGTYQSKTWLINTANVVDSRARGWGAQLKRCGIR